MARAIITSLDGTAAEAFLLERFGLEWGPDVLGIEQNGVSAELNSIDGGVMKITLVARCTRDDVEQFIHALYAVGGDRAG